jgi:hypothetical protein
MGYQIQMVPEVEAWLARLRDTDAQRANQVDEAINALRTAGENLGAPLVVPLDAGQAQPPPDVSYQRELEVLARAFRSLEAWLAGLRARSAVFAPLVDEAMMALRALGRSLGPLFAVPPGTGSARELLDDSYQRQLEMLTRVRRGVADVATSRKRVELQVEQLREQLTDEMGDNKAARDKLSELEDQLAAMAAEEERLTRASQRLQAKVDAFRTRKEAVKAHWLADEVAADIAETERLIDQAQALADPVPLMELRPGALDAVSARILFIAKPDGTAVLLAAGAEQDWVQAWQTQAAATSRARLTRGRSE